MLPRLIASALVVVPAALAGDPPRFEPLQQDIPGIPAQLVVADLDRDGVPDVVATTVSGFAFQPLITLRGTGAGDFSAPFTGSSSGNDHELVVADFDGDDLPDAAFGSTEQFSGTSIRVFHGPGDTTLPLAADVLVPKGAAGLGAGDFDLDGDLDLIASQHSATMLPLLNDPPGHFTVGATVGADAGTVLGLRVGDVDGDGLPDVLAWSDTGPASQPLYLLRGDGAGGLQAAELLGALPVSVDTVELIDVDLDQDIDAVVSAGAQVATWLADGTGSFTPAAPLVLGMEGADIALGDVSGDGLPDLVLGGSEQVAWAPSLGAGLFGPLVHLAEGVDAVVLIDSDLDGRLDLLHAVVDGLAVLRNTGGGAFVLPEPLVTEAAPTELLLSDMSGDGEPDSIVVATGPNRVVLRPGLGGGSFGSGQTLLQGSQTVTEVGLGDVNEDGALDLLVSRTASLIILSDTRIYAGTGDGTVIATPLATVSQVGVHTLLADLDQDGHLDLAGLSGTSWRHIRGAGHGTFQGVFTHPIGAAGVSLAAGDMDADGRVDMVVITSEPPQLQLHHNSSIGSGNFDLSASLPLPFEPRGVVLADLDGDGLLDAGVAHEQGYWGSVDASLWFGTGSSFVAGDAVPTGTRNLGLRAADLDGDGAPDLLTRPAQGSTSLLRNDGTGHVTTPPGPSSSMQTIDVAVDDVDGDGLADLIVAQSLLGQLALIRQLAPPTWCSVAGGKPGTHGVPLLTGAGTLQASTPLTLSLTGALESAPLTLVVGLSEASLPFKGGTLVPNPDLLLAGLLTAADGKLELPATWPAGLPPGLELWLQAWITDAAATHGLSATTGLRALSP